MVLDWYDPNLIWSHQWSNSKHQYRSLLLEAMMAHARSVQDPRGLDLLEYLGCSAGYHYIQTVADDAQS